MRAPKSPATQAFVDISVVDLAKGSITEHQTVVVQGGRILTVEPAGSAPLPSGARVVWQSGGFLMPGLADLHVHIHGEADLLLFLLNGVTTVRNMWGFSRHLAIRHAVEDGRILGPTVYTTGPIVDGAPPYWNFSVPISTAEEGVAEVRRQKAAGYSAVKVYGHLSRAAYAAIVEEAARHDLPVVGHVPREVQLAGALEAHQRSIEHLEGWLEAVQSDKAPWKGRLLTREEYARSGEFWDPALVPVVAQQVARSGSWSCPTLTVVASFASPAQVTDRLARPEMRWCPPALVSGWDPSKDFRFRTLPQAFWDQLPTIVQRRGECLRALREAGGKVLVGTDTPNPWVVPGFSLHEELDRMVECGYSNLEVLRMATQGAAEFLETPQEFGVVAPGARADLLVVEENPLSDLSCVRQPVGVMARGHWLSREGLDRLSGALLRSYDAGQRRVLRALRDGTPEPPSEASTYGIEAFGHLVGMEATWPSESGLSLHGRLVLDAPPGVTRIESEWSFRRPAEVARIRTRMQFFEGRETIAIARGRGGYKIHDTTGGASGGRTGLVPAGPDAVLGPIQVASFLPLAGALRALEPDQSLERDVIRIESETVLVGVGKLKAKRPTSPAEGSGSVMRFDLEEKWPNGSFSGSIEIAPDGRVRELRWLGGNEELVWTPVRDASTPR